MADTTQVFYRGAAPTSTNVNIYTAPPGTTAVITNIVFINTTGATQATSMFFDEVALYSSYAVPVGTTFVSGINLPIFDSKSIRAFSASASVIIHLYGYYAY